MISYFPLIHGQAWQNKGNSNVHILDTVLKNTFSFERIISQNNHMHNVYIVVTERQAKHHYLDFLQVKDGSKQVVDYNSFRK